MIPILQQDYIKFAVRKPENLTLTTEEKINMKNLLNDTLLSSLQFSCKEQSLLFILNNSYGAQESFKK